MVFATSPSHPSVKPGSYLADIALLVIGGSAFLIAVILWFDNAQGGVTGNGVFKSYELKAWIVDPASAPLYPSNVLFYPVYGAGCRLLDLFDVFAGDPRRQITILNALSASICLSVVYVLVRHLTGRRSIALAAAFFHVSCNGVLTLAIINEDIMSSYTVMFSSMALAGVWFANPTALRVVAVSILFSVGWLFEWRLMFPTLPAMAAALWLSEERWARRLGWIALFAAGMAAMASIAAWATQGHKFAVGPFGLLWTGKAVDSAWAGFSWIKVRFLSDGMSAYFLGTWIAERPNFPGWDVWRFTALILELTIAWISLSMMWRARADRLPWALAAVFGGTFAAGEVFNLYSQPHDPQMQINVMAWLTVGWGFVLAAAHRRWGGRGLAVMIGLTAMLLFYNLWSMTPLRGVDTKWRLAIERLERKADPTRTVFVIHDFDWASTYATASWGSVYPEIDGLGPSPQTEPKFKRIGLIGSVLQHHGRTEAQHVAALRQQIDHAFELGYDVVIINLWDVDQYFLDQLTGTVAAQSLIHAYVDMLHRDFVVTLLMDDPVLGKVYRLQRGPRP